MLNTILEFLAQIILFGLGISFCILLVWLLTDNDSPNWIDGDTPGDIDDGKHR